MHSFSHFYSFISHKKYFFYFSVFLFFCLPISTNAQFTKKQCEAFPLGECVDIGMDPINVCTKKGKKAVGSCQSSAFETCCAEDKNPTPPITNGDQCTSQQGVCEDGDSCGPKAFAIGECAPNKACCKQSPSYTDPTTNASFDYDPLEPIPGTEGMDTSTLKGFLEGLFLFVLWSAGIASLFMISIGGFWYMTSAGNTSRVTEAKNIIANALWGLVVVLITWLILYVINPDLVRIDLSNLEALFIEGKVYYDSPHIGGGGGYGGAKPGNGTCSPVPSGPCSIDNLKSTCLAPNAEVFSKICNVESGGDPNSYSQSDKCRDGNSFSIGLFQINLTVHSIGGLNCPKAFSAKNYACTVINPSLYEQCVKAAQNPNINIQKSCELSRNGSKVSPWRYTSEKCGFL